MQSEIQRRPRRGVLVRIAAAAFATLVLTIAWPIVASSASDSIIVTNRIELPEGFQYPNGIAHASDGALFVGSVTSGRILKSRPGSGWKTLFAGSNQIFAGTTLRLDEPRGLLWGASPDFLGRKRAGGSIERRRHRMFALDARSGEVRKVILMPDAGMGNDIAIAPDGGIYVTDSRHPRVLYLPPGGDRFETYVEDKRFAPGDGIGLAGIALAFDGTLALGMFDAGRLFLVRRGTNGEPAISEIELPRRLENPDGLRFTPDGQGLLVTEGAVESGNGKLLRIDVGTPTENFRSIEVLASGLESPVNLTLAADGRVWVTESRIRHRLLPGREGDVPDKFWITSFDLILEATGGGALGNAMSLLASGGVCVSYGKAVLRVESH